LLPLTLAGTRALASDAEEKEACIRGSDEGQQLRDEGKYRLAREAFMRCARETCPTLVKHDCAQWLADLDQRAATVVISAQDARGNDMAEVKVFVDGAPLVEKLDGQPVPVDPGEHVFHYEAAGFPSVDKHVVIHATEKNRVLQVQFSATATQPATLHPSPQGALGEAVPRSRATAPQPVVWIFGGTAIAAFASETYFGLAGLGERSRDLSPGGCAPHCASSEKNAIQTKFAIADISLGVGLVSTCLAAYFFLRPPQSHAGPVDPPATIELSPRAGGGVATVGGRF
jgi:hypothetical protein